jgi:UDP-glucose:(heptosyl)LPS alpha-1,3-glucosyltransferase
MNLLLVISHFQASTGGAEAFAVMVARRLTDRGHRITVFAEDGSAPEGIELVCGTLDSVSTCVEAVGPDLVLDWGLNVPADVHRLGGGTHREFQRIFLESCPALTRPVKAALYRLLPRHRRIAASERALLEAPGAHFIAVSDFVRRQVLRTAAVEPDRVCVLHNGVDTDRFHPDRNPEERCALRARIGLQADDVAFLFVAHNLKLKNVRLLSTIFPRVRRECPTAKLLVLGRRNPGLRADWARYVPHTDRPEDVYAAVDALVHPTYYDACANVVLEAMASGLPVVSSDRNGSAELIRDGSNGFVLPVVGSGNLCEDTWAQTLGRLAAGAGERRAVGRAARNTALDHTIDAYIDTFEKHLESIRPAR